MLLRTKEVKSKYWRILRITVALILFRMGLFGAAHGWGRGKKSPLPKISHTLSTMMKLGSYTLRKENPKNI